MRSDPPEGRLLPGSARDRVRRHPLGLTGGGLLCALLAASAAGGGENSGVPGCVIARSLPATRQYIGSPGIVAAGARAYVVSHDLFGPGTACNLTRIFRSEDGGATWRRVAELEGQFWSTLFSHRDALYIMGTAARYGAVVIRRSADGGRTWTVPADKDRGLLLDDGRFHTAPVPVVRHAGRLWRSMEDLHPGLEWPRHFRAFVMSAPEDADLLRAQNWTAGNRLPFDPEWLPGAEAPGWLEGNIVVTPAGGLANVLRVNAEPAYGKAALANLSEDGRLLSFEPAGGFVAFPGGMAKFTIRHDARSGQYWSLANTVENPGNPRQRNVLALVSSPDLRDWTVRRTVLRHPDEARVAFQYADWLVEGDDIVAVCRTAFGDAPNAHDAGHLTFHRIRAFRAEAAPAGKL